MWWFSTHLYFSYFCFISKINPGYKILKNCFVSSQFHLLQIRTSKKPASKVHNLFFCVLLVQIICQSRLRQLAIVKVLLLSNFPNNLYCKHCSTLLLLQHLGLHLMEGDIFFKIFCYEFRTFKNIILILIPFFKDQFDIKINPAHPVVYALLPFK